MKNIFKFVNNEWKYVSQINGKGEEIYEVNFNKELSLATSSNKAVRLALKMINAFVDTNSKIMEELSLPLNLNITIYKKNSEHLQNPASFVNNVKLLNNRKQLFILY